MQSAKLAGQEWRIECDKLNREDAEKRMAALIHARDTKILYMVSDALLCHNELCLSDWQADGITSRLYSVLDDLG